MLTAQAPGNGPVEVTIAVGPDGHVRVQGEHGRRGSCVCGARDPVFGAGADEPAGASGSRVGEAGVGRG